MAAITARARCAGKIKQEKAGHKKGTHGTAMGNNRKKH
jgi:hypothetical protein